MNILLYAPHPWPIDEAPLEPHRHQIERVKGSLAELVKVAAQHQPDLLLLSGFDAQADLLKVLEVLCTVLPKATVALHHDQVSPEQLVALMRVGVRDVIADSQPDTLQHLVARASARLHSAQPHKSKVLGIITSKDGDWGSCVSANLGHCLAELSHARVLLIDLSLPFGDLDMYLTNQTDMKDLVDISAEAGRMDNSLLDSMVHHLTPNLHLIASPISFEKVLRVQPDNIRRLIEIATGHYNYVVLDMGTALDQLCLSVLSQVDDICLVGSSILPSIRRVSQILKLLKTLDYDDVMVSVVVNRFDEKGPISRQEMEKVIGQPIRCHLALEYAAMQNSLLTGKAIMELEPDSKFAHAVREWTSQITGLPIPKRTLWQRLRMR